MELEIALGQQRVLGEKRQTMEQDELLAHAIARGDTEAWDGFFARYAPWAYRFAFRHLRGNTADAEDLCSDIMLTVAKSIARFDARRGDLDAWVSGLARHQLSRFCRSRHLEDPLLGDDAAPSSVTDTTSSRLTDTVVLRDLVNRALASLPERQATALVAKYVEGYSTDELARRIESTPKAAESLLVRARTAFRAAYSALLDGPSGGGYAG
jgi:RNA polymerase sigma-70 factor (ECF subfamily)